MKILKILIASILVLSIFNCSSDDDSGESNGINAKNLVINFDENPSNGAIVGTIQAVSENILSFSITSQTPAGALSINPSTGELKVANATLFDFETNPVINATISILDLNYTTSATATINLNDLDDIASFLSTSKADYIAAADGEWIIVSEGEYNALASKLNHVSRAGTTENEYTNSSFPITESSSSGWVISNVTSANMPANSFVFAFKYHIYSGTNVSSSKVKQSSTSISDGYSDLGTALPLHSGNQENICFVLKGSNSMTTNEGYLAFYKAESTVMGKLQQELGSQTYYHPGDVNEGLTLTTGIQALYQGLSTTQKQW